ncbi:hypothetical protein CDAR_220391 [Caerostris darwini]|uniref:Uncharacterized protein n=1 Tax=Caerostris darwini TaxID=1538125 RepID=A0AAV4UFF0_9ARAC|nr:hypothetical protein CDAR_220391 [Caerostris darwini]
MQQNNCPQYIVKGKTNRVDSALHPAFQKLVDFSISLDSGNYFPNAPPRKTRTDNYPTLMEPNLVETGMGGRSIPMLGCLIESTNPKCLLVRRLEGLICRPLSLWDKPLSDYLVSRFFCWFI